MTGDLAKVDRKQDPVDGIIFELCRHQAPSSMPTRDGRLLANHFWRIIDLTTQPAELSPKEGRQLTLSIERHNQHASYIFSVLEPELLDPYRAIAKQVNNINLDNINRDYVPLMDASNRGGYEELASSLHLA